MKKGYILHVIDKMDPQLGGVSQAVRTMIMGLNTRGIYSEVASLDSPDSPFLKDEICIVNALGPSKSPWSYSSNLFPWLVDNFSRFDSIILHGLWLYNSFAVYKALKKYRNQHNVSIVPQMYVFPHGMLDPYFQKASGRKIKALRNWAYWKMIESKVVNNANGLLFTCEEERRLAHIPFSPYLPKRENVVGLGVEEPPVFNLEMMTAFIQKCPEVSNQPYLLFLSRIHEKKGVDLLIKAYASLIKAKKQNASGLNSSFPKLVIAGPGLDTLYGENIVKSVEEDHELNGHVIFPGMLSGQAKWGAFYGCEAFVLPSHQENFGIAVVEAMACSKPVLISNQIHIWREIESGGGALIADDTEEGTYELLSKWLDLSENKKNTLSINSRDTYLKFFGMEANHSKLMKALQYE